MAYYVGKQNISSVDLDKKGLVSFLSNVPSLLVQMKPYMYNINFLTLLHEVLSLFEVHLKSK